MKIIGTAILQRQSINDKWTLLLKDREKMVNEIGMSFGGMDNLHKPIIVEFRESEKVTNKEFGYFHAEILPKLIIAYRLLGYNVLNENMAKNQLKLDCGYYEKIEYYKTKDELISYPKPKSFSRAGKREMANIMEMAINICFEAGVEVMSSEEYKRINNLE